MFPRAEAVPTVGVNHSFTPLFFVCVCATGGRVVPAGDNVRVVESYSTGMLKLVNQKRKKRDYQEFYSLMKETVLFKPAQIAEAAQSKQRT